MPQLALTGRLTFKENWLTPPEPTLRITPTRSLSHFTTTQPWGVLVSGSLWTETDSVTTVDGIFRVALGSNVAFPANFNFNWDGLYLGVKVGSDSEMTPRIQMAAVPFALNAQQVAGLTVQDSSGTASTSATLQIGNSTTPTTFNLGANNLTFSTSGTTTLTLPTTGTLLTNTATANQTVTSTQTSGNVLSIADTSGTGTLAGISFNLNGSGTTYDLLGTSSNWSITKAGALTVASCVGCGSPFAALTGVGLNMIVQNNTTEDLLLGGTSTASAVFAVLGLSYSNHQTTASASGNLVVMPNNGWGGNASISGGLTLGAFAANSLQTTKNQLLTIGGNTTGDIQFMPGNSSTSLYLSSGGSVGIGTTPGYKLDVNGDINLSQGLTYRGGGIAMLRNVSSTENKIFTAGVGQLTFAEGGGGNTVMILTSTASLGLGLGLVAPAATLDVRGNSATLAAASFSGQTTFAALVTNNNGVGDLFTASASGWTRFVISNAGAVTMSGNANVGGNLAFTGPNPSISNTGANTLTLNSGSSGDIQFFSSSYKITQGGALTVASCTGCGGGGTNYWNLTNGNGFANQGYITPINSTADFLIGSQATSSAAFAVLGLSTAGHQTTASVSGNFIVMPNNGYGGQVGIGTTSPLGALDVNNSRVKLQIAGGTLLLDNNQAIDFLDTDGITPRVVLGVSNAGNTFLRNANANGHLDFRTQNNTTVMSLVDSTGYIGINTVAPLTILDVRGIMTQVPVASFSGNLSVATLVTNNNGVGDLFTASASGWTRFTIQNNGNIAASGTLTGLTGLTLASGAVTLGGSTGTGQCLTGGTTAGWGVCGTNYWNLTNGNGFANQGYITPINSTADFLIGSQATSSAAFAVLGLSTAGHQTTASVSGNFNVMPNNGYGGNASISGNLTIGAFGASAIQTTSYQLLTIGGNTTGNILLNPKNSNAGLVYIGPSVGSAAFVFSQTDGGSPAKSTLALGLAGTTNGGIIFNSAGASIAPPTITADSNGNLILATAQPNATVQLGYGSGNVSLSLVNASDLFKADKTLTAAANYGGLDFQFKRVITGGANALTGAVLSIIDISSGSNTIAPDLILGNAAPTSGTYTGNLLRLQVNGLDRFVVTGTGVAPIASLSGQTSFAALAVNNNGVGDLITASASGITKFTVSNTGVLRLAGGSATSDIDTLTGTTLKIGASTATGLTFGNSSVTGITLNVGTSGNFTLQKNSAAYVCNIGTGKLVTDGSGNIICGTDSYSPFAEITGVNGGVIVANNSTMDVLLGGQSSASAAFRVTGQGNPFAGTLAAASVSAHTSFAGLVIDQAGPGDIFTASASGVPLFTVQKNGNLVMAGNGSGISFTGTGINAITTASNQNLAINPGGNGLLGINTDNTTPLANLDVRLNVGTVAIASFSGATSFAGLVVDNSGTGSLITASASGATRFVVNQNGSVGVGGSLANSGYKLDVIGSARIAGNATNDDIVKDTTSDFTQGRFCTVQAIVQLTSQRQVTTFQWWLIIGKRRSAVKRNFNPNQRFIGFGNYAKTKRKSVLFRRSFGSRYYSSNQFGFRVNKRN